VEPQAAISADVLARYAADAAREVDGVSALAEGPLQRPAAVTVSGDDDNMAVTVAVELEWGRSAAEVGVAVQRRVSEYLTRMANVTPGSVDVIVDSVASPLSRR
jgi:uncharacterized alkaline shock family protein YloU